MRVLYIEWLENLTFYSLFKFLITNRHFFLIRNNSCSVLLPQELMKKQWEQAREIPSHWWDYKIHLKFYNTDGEKGWDVQFKPGWVSQDAWRENSCPQGAVWSLLGARISGSLSVSLAGKAWDLWKLRGLSWKRVLLRRVGWWSGDWHKVIQLFSFVKGTLYGGEARDGCILKAAKLEVKLPHEE